jgi:hypothetical protein
VGSCGTWTTADAVAFQAATVTMVDQVLAAFAAAGKWPLLSIRQDGTINEPLRRFQASVNPLLKQRGGFRFMEALCQQYTMPCTLDGTTSNASACCVSQVQELVQQSADGVPLAVHGWAQGDTPHEFYLAAFLVGMGNHSYFSISGGSEDVKAAGGDGSMWAEHSFPFFPEYTKPLGRPLGPPVRHSWGVWTRSFEHLDVYLDVSPKGVAHWNASLSWH